MTTPIVPGTREAYFDALRDDDPALLYDAAPCGYLSTTPDGLITKANRTLLAILGRSRDDVVGRLHLTDLLTAGGRIFHKTHYAQMLRMQGTVQEIALDLVRGDGSRTPVLVNAVLDRDASGEPQMIRVAVFDATHRRAYERELQREKERAEEAERRAQDLARTLQQTLIPPSPPAIPGLDVGAVFRAGARGVDVGGDFYDVFHVGGDEWVVIIGDVRGKGVEAATVATLTRYTLRAMCMEHRSPSDALRRTNDVLRAQQTDRFCSALCLRLTAMGTYWYGTVSSAGHPLPLLRSPDGSVAEVGRTGLLLNVEPAPALTDAELDLAPNATLLLCTDGVSEGRAGEQFYGDARLTAMLRTTFGTAQEIARDIVEDNLAFQAGAPRDDIALVVVRVPAPD